MRTVPNYNRQRTHPHLNGTQSLVSWTGGVGVTRLLVNPMTRCPYHHTSAKIQTDSQSWTKTLTVNHSSIMALAPLSPLQQSNSSISLLKRSKKELTTPPPLMELTGETTMAPGSSSGSDSSMNSETPSRRPSLSAHYDLHPQTLPRWSLDPTSPNYKPWLVVGSLNCRTSRTNIIQENKDSSYRQLTILGLQEPYNNPLIEPPQSYSIRHFKGSLAQLKGTGDLVTLRVVTVTNK